MKTYNLYIKSHCNYPDYDSYINAENEKEAIEKAYKELRGEFDREFIAQNLQEETDEDRPNTELLTEQAEFIRDMQREDGIWTKKRTKYNYYSRSYLLL